MRYSALCPRTESIGTESTRATATRATATRAAARLLLASFVPLLLTAGSVLAQDANPDNYDYLIRTDKATYAPDETVTADVGLATRMDDIQGWSYGVAHDAAVLAILTATVGADTTGLTPRFEQTTIVEGGFFQSVILSLDANAVMLPVSEFFSLAQATYGAAAGACDGQDGDLATSLSFSDELGAGGENSPAVETVVVVGGRSVVPSRKDGADLSIACMMMMIDGLSLSFDETACDLVADTTSTFDINVLLANVEGGAAVDLQGWSYGVEFDGDALEFVSGAPGADSQALKGGAGPDFASYQMEQSADGSAVGVTVGVVIELDGPEDTVLSVGGGASVNIDTITVKSRVAIADGEPAQQTTLSFSENLGGGPDRDPIEVLFVAGGDSVIPDFTATKTLNLLPGGVIEPPVDGLVLSFDEANCDLVADQTATLDLDVLLRSGADTAAVDVQAWSYGVAFDGSELEFVSGAPGADAQGLNGGAGPDFASYDASQSADGSVVGVIVGVIISTDDGGDGVINVAPNARLHVDRITVRSSQAIPADGAARTTTVSFTDQLGGTAEREPIEILLVSGGLTLEVDSTATKTVNLLPGGDGPALARFLRSDATTDGRPDLADGIFLINELFYNGPAAACPAAADANADGGRDLTDAMFIFQYWLQPNATPDNLFPAPSAPFPDCGTAPGITMVECPASACMN